MSSPIALKILKGKPKVYGIHSFDIETHGQKNLFLLGGYYDGKRYKSFTDKGQMIKFIYKSSDKNNIVFATNLGFDFNALYFKEKEYIKFDKLLRDGNYILTRYENIVMSDTMNFSKSSVERLGKILKLHKLKHPKFLGKIPKNNLEWKYLRDYNSVDCKISAVFMQQFQTLLNSLNGELKTTIASSAMDLYRRNFQPFDIYKEPDYKQLRAMIFDSYYGGRTEAFARGILPKNKYKVYDYNSLYPSVMLNKYPLPQSAVYIKSKKNDRIQHDIINNEGISKVKIFCPYMMYPLLPYRTKDKLLFPYGNIEGTYTHVELRKAVELGYKIIDISESIIYTKTFYPFTDYVNTLYALRLKYKKENNEVFAECCKLLLNSLYGKFGMRYIEDFDFYDLRDENTTAEMIKGSMVVNDDYAYDSKTFEIDYNYCIPILASYTTAYARLKLYEAIEKSNPVYVDTDSCFTDVDMEDNLELGHLKKEKTIKRGYIIKPKVYDIIDENDKEYIKVKGFKKMSQKEFFDMLNGKKIKQQKFMKIKEALKRGFDVNEIINFDKEAVLIDTKRQWKKGFDITELQWSKPKMVSCF